MHVIAFTYKPRTQRIKWHTATSIESYSPSQWLLKYEQISVDPTTPYTESSIYSRNKYMCQHAWILFQFPSNCCDTTAKRNYYGAPVCWIELSDLYTTQAARLSYRFCILINVSVFYSNIWFKIFFKLSQLRGVRGKHGPSPTQLLCLSLSKRANKHPTYRIQTALQSFLNTLELYKTTVFITSTPLYSFIKYVSSRLHSNVFS